MLILFKRQPSSSPYPLARRSAATTVFIAGHSERT